MAFHLDSFSIRVRFRTAQDNEGMAATIHREVNKERTKHGLAPLEWDGCIQKIAEAKCRQMAKAGITDHQGFNKRVKHVKSLVPVARSVGENVGSVALLPNPEMVMIKGWMSSPGHYQNIMGNFQQAGVAVQRQTLGQYYFTQIFVRV